MKVRPLAGDPVTGSALAVEDGLGVRSSRRELIVGIGATIAIGAVLVLISAQQRRPRPRL